MRRVIIVTDGTYANDGATEVAGYDDINTLEAGAIVFLDQDGTKIDKAAPAFSGDRFTIAIGLDSTNEVVDISPQINRATLQYNQTDYTAAAKKKMFIGYEGAAGAHNLPTLVAGQVASVLIVDKQVSQEKTNERQRQYDYVVKAADVDQDVIDGLVALINADSLCPATAAAVSTDKGISLEAKTAGRDFTAQVNITDSILSSADIYEYNYVNKEYDGSYTTNSVKHTKGFGVAASLVPEELASKVRQGYQNSFKYNDELWSFPSNYSASLTYDQYVLTWTDPKNDRLQSKDAPYVKELIIYVDSTKTTLVAYIDAILAAAL
jgi:hypothetical protein